MTQLPVARRLLAERPKVSHGAVVLSYDERLLRRKRLVTEAGTSFLVDLASVTNLDDFWGFELEDGRAIEVCAAVEALVEVTGPQLYRYAWHIGNRHTPCQIEPARLLIRIDHVLESMLKILGATLIRVNEPFRPEGGAYGHGRTMGHSHGPETDQAHGPGGQHFEPQEDRAKQRSEAGADAELSHTHRAGCGCHPVPDVAAQPYQAWSPEADPAPDAADYGWHHHGDGKMHYHPPLRRISLEAEAIAGAMLQNRAAPPAVSDTTNLGAGTVGEKAPLAILAKPQTRAR